jgi:SpoVK/Ycf46/Vps4 family AAA+-type ATPase
MDKLRTRSNVLFICTSNLRSSLDTAFIDRCGIKQDVGSPSTACAYEIFQTMINELIKNSLVLYDGADQHTHGSSSSSSSSSFVGINDFDTTMSNAPEIEGQSYIPSLSHTTLHLSHLPDCAPRKLYKLAQQAEGLSGRTLRRLPILALTKYTDDEPCTIQDLLTALKQVIAEEKASQNEDYELNTAVSSKNRETGDEFRKDSSENGDAEEAEDGTSELGSENWLFSMDSVRDGIRGIGIGQS